MSPNDPKLTDAPVGPSPSRGEGCSENAQSNEGAAGAFGAAPCSAIADVLLRLANFLIRPKMYWDVSEVSKEAKTGTNILWAAVPKKNRTEYWVSKPPLFFNRFTKRVYGFLFKFIVVNDERVLACGDENPTLAS